VTLTLIYIAIAAVLVLLNGFFVLVEFAIVKARRTRLEMLKAEGVDGARLAIEMQKHINDLPAGDNRGLARTRVDRGARLCAHL
jgi:CBS domain containing-hemolysin-like protein